MTHSESLEKLITDQSEYIKKRIRFSARRSEELFQFAKFDMEKALDIAVKEFLITASTVASMAVDEKDFAEFVKELMQSITNSLLENPSEIPEELKRMHRGYVKRKAQ